MAEKDRSDSTNISALNLRLVYKLMLAAGLIIVIAVAILNYFFLHELAQSKVTQVSNIANTTSIIVSKLAIRSLDDEDPSYVNTALNESMVNAGENETGFLQISIILYPDGVYYASTNNNIRNRKVGTASLGKNRI